MNRCRSCGCALETDALFCVSCQEDLEKIEARPERWWTSTSVPMVWILASMALGIAFFAESSTGRQGGAVLADVIEGFKLGVALVLSLVGFVLATRLSILPRVVGTGGFLGCLIITLLSCS